MTVNFIEHTTDNFKKALVGAASVDAFTDWDQINRSLQIADTDFLTDITLVGEVSGTGDHTDAMAIKLSNVIADSNFELAFADKDEGVLAVTFTAHFTPTDLETEPWTLYWPKES